jgi:hypothetical protein
MVTPANGSDGVGVGTCGVADCLARRAASAPCPSNVSIVTAAWPDGAAGGPTGTAANGGVGVG